MNLARVRALILKDWLELVSDKNALLPIVLVPVIFVVVMPTLVILLGDHPSVRGSINGLDQFLSNLPAGAFPADFTLHQTLIFAFVIFFMAPLFLIIPVMVASIVASSSFAGEKERRTVEGLLYTPLTDRELVLGKILVSFFPAVAVTWLAFLVYAVLVNVLAGAIMPSWFFPNTAWLAMQILLVPAVAFVTIAFTVAVSQRAKTMQGAQSAAGFLVLPIIALVLSQVAGVLVFGTGVVLMAALVLWLVGAGAYFWVVRLIDRERMAAAL